MLVTGGLQISNGGFVIEPAPPAVILTDSFFKYVTLLISGDGVNNKTNNTFLDTSPYNFTISNPSNQLNITQSSFSPYSKNPGEWSVYFGGTGTIHFLNVAYNANLILSGEDCTIECWAYLDEVPQSGANASTPRAQPIAVQGVGSYSNNPNDHNWMLFVDNTNIYFGKSPNFVTANASVVPIRQWTHIVATMSSTGVGELYIDGVQVASQSGRTTLGTSTSYSTRIGRGTFGSGGGLSSDYEGYISNFRIVKGTRVYTTAFTPPTTPLTAITNTQLLTCQNNRVEDKSPNNFSIQRGATSMVVSTFSPFTSSDTYSPSVRGGSIYLNSAYIGPSSANALHSMGTGDFTIESWLYVRNIVTGQNTTLWGAYDSSIGLQTEMQQNGTLQFRANANVVITATETLKEGDWNHIALTRTSGVTKMFLNGKQTGSDYTDTNNYTFSLNRVMRVGSLSSSTSRFNVSDFRVIKGSSLYSANFSVPTTPLTSVSDTVLLMNGSNAGVYDSAKSIMALSTAGDVKISTTEKKFGNASIYFDGTGDYVRRPASSGDDYNLGLYKFGTGNFTIEMWAYFSRVTGVQYLYDGRAGSEGALPALYANGTSLVYRVSSVDRITAASALTANTWCHIALCRSGTSTRLFLDGVQVGTTYTDTTKYFGAGSGGPHFGASGVGAAGTSAFQGYLDEIRITKGVARYTANFTTPTEAFLAR